MFEVWSCPSAGNEIPQYGKEKALARRTTTSSVTFASETKVTAAICCLPYPHTKAAAAS